MEGEPTPMAMMELSPPRLGGPESSPQPRDRTRRAAQASAATRLGELVRGFGSSVVVQFRLGGSGRALIVLASCPRAPVVEFV